MSLDVAMKFFEACETGQGWDGCKAYVAHGASFSAQSEPIADMTTIESYAEWMKVIVTQTMPGAVYELHTAAFDEQRRAATFFATFHAKHTGEGGPVPPTGRSTVSHYVYVLYMDGNDKVTSLTKVWNAPWAMNELGWA